MKVLIENTAGSDQKNIFDEKTLQHKKAYTVSRAYPFPYGFVMNTISGDNAALDCFIITNKILKSGEVVEVEPVEFMEQFQDDKDDHKIIAVFPNEGIEITDEIRNTLKDFVSHVFDHLKDTEVTTGNFLGKEAALDLVDKSSRFTK